MDRFRQIVDTAPDAMIVVNSGGVIVYANLEAGRLFGYPCAELVGKSHDILLPERFRGVHAGHTEQFLAQPKARPMGAGMDLVGLAADGREIPIEVGLGVLHATDETLVLAAIRDVTERKRAQEALLASEVRHRELIEQLREAQRIAEAASAAKSDFLSSMSHELRTPFNAILGFAQLLYRDRREPLTPHQRERVGQILKGADHLLHLIDDVLDFSRIEAGKVSISIEPVSVAEVLDDVIAGLRPAAERAHVSVERAALPDALLYVQADRTRLAQILLNYGMNAVKYNRPGGTVRFEVSAPGAARVRLSVADTGIGIPPDKQGRLFEPFQRAGQEAGPIEGTGIGLAISKHLAELMRGAVGFRSAFGNGSEFWVDLMANEASALPSASSSPREAKPSSLAGVPRAVVLYIEDNAANVALMRDLLDGYPEVELTTAATAELGLEIARARHPKVILMDINLPGMSGLDAMQVLRAWPETRDIPVVALTAAARERDRQIGKAAGFFRYLAKPVKIDELEAALEELLGTGAPRF